MGIATNKPSQGEGRKKNCSYLFLEEEHFLLGALFEGTPWSQYT